MASVALTRVTGKVLDISKRDGIIKNGPRAGEPWLIETANILVANKNVTVVQLPRRDSFGQVELASGFPVDDAIVDYLVEVSVYGQDVQARVLEDFPEKYSAEALELAAS